MVAREPILSSIFSRPSYTVLNNHNNIKLLQ